MQVNLVFLKKDGTTSSFSLPSTVTFIGRRQDCDFCIPLPVVSRRHCEINLDAGRVTVRDLASRNGTLVNGTPVEEAQLKPGDVLKIGPVEFVTQVDGTPSDFGTYLQDAGTAAPDHFPESHSDDFDAAVFSSDNELEENPAAEEESLSEAMKNLSKQELGGSHTELLGDLSKDLEFDEDFNL